MSISARSVSAESGRSSIMDSMRVRREFSAEGVQEVVHSIVIAAASIMIMGAKDGFMAVDAKRLAGASVLQR